MFFQDRGYFVAWQPLCLLQLMKGGAHLSPFAALSFPNLKKYQFSARLTEFPCRRMAQPSLELTRYGDFLHHSRAALTTRPRRLSWRTRTI